MLNLNIDLTQVDTSFPVLAPGTYQMRIDEVVIAPNKAGTGSNLVVSFATTDEEQTKNGDSLKPGFKVRKWYPLQASEHSADSWLRNLVILTDAVFKITDPSERKPFNEDLIAAMRGNEVKCTVKVSTDQSGAVNNDISFVAAV